MVGLYYSASILAGRASAPYVLPPCTSASTFRPTVIDKSWPIESIGLRLRDHTRTFDSGVRARSTYHRTLLAKR